jgi:L-2-hydroxyglutarate oxidase LhgO
LYSYCAEHDVWHRQLGKLVVASSKRAVDNGVGELRWLTGDEVRELEPEVVAHAGLWSPMTGIVDSHALLARLKTDAVAAGATVVESSEVLCGTLSGTGWQVRIGGQDPFEVRCQVIVNAAGVCAQALARKLVGLPAETIPPAYIAKGQYYQLNGPSPFQHLVYPLPDVGGLGVHVTLDASGAARFGPDVSWVDSVDYSFDGSRLKEFVEAVRRYYPTLDTRRLSPGYTGLRAKVVGPGEPAGDFVIQGPADLGVPIVNLYGIESPGLTASLAIADYVEVLLRP